MAACVVKETLKFDVGNVMMWSCMMSEAVGMYEGRMNAQCYITLVKNSTSKWGKDALCIVFQHDNDPRSILL